MIATKIRPKTLNEVQPASLAKLTPATRDENPIIEHKTERISTCGRVILLTF